jgi:hypothetical protein
MNGRDPSLLGRDEPAMPAKVEKTEPLKERSISNSIPEVLAVEDAGEVPEVEAEGVVPVFPAVDAG